MWEDANYCWVVLCKNHLFHMRQNIFFRHRIPLGQTDAVTPLPPLGKHFTVRCDDCRKTYTYKPRDVRRVELDLPESFKPHPLFLEEPALNDSKRSNQEEARHAEPHQAEPSQKEPPQEGQTRAKGV